MKKRNIITVLLSFAYLCCFSQTNNQEVFITIEGPNTHEEITKSEFERIYSKNNTSSTIDTIKSAEEYLDLFINFKLKVLEAEALGYDTMPSFLDEYSRYKNQLAKPYLTSKDVKEKLVKKAYEFKKEAVHASHILVKIDFDKATPEDTLHAYKKIHEIRDRIVRGEPFDKVARASSDDPSVKRNGGDLGYFTVFKFPYKFEKTAHELPEGKLSEPFKTSYGYHLIKVHDKKEAQGKIKVAHIMKFTPRGMSQENIDSVENVINDIYQKLQNGADFAELAKEYSDDKRSAKNGGEMKWFGIGEMVPVFEEASYALKENGDISEPVKTRFGFHIIKRIDKKEFPAFEDIKDELESKIEKGPTKKIIQNHFINKLKEKHEYKQHTSNLSKIIRSLDSAGYFNNTWTFNTNSLSLEGKLIEIGDTVFTQKDMAEYLNKIKSKQRWKKTPRAQFVHEMFDRFADNKIMSYEKSLLDEKYPKFRHLSREYHDGILLFNIMDDKVWSKAVKDTTGIKKFYESNKNKYMWDKRVRVTIYECPGEESAKATEKYARKKEKKGYTDENIIEKVKEKEGKEITIEHKTFAKGENKKIDNLKWKEGISDFYDKQGAVMLIQIDEVLPRQPKKFNEARGLVTSDYQDYLEKKWLEELRQKYTITINKKMLDEF
jgi:peptidyl-prolyl cis-trans isomerase SurA